MRSTYCLIAIVVACNNSPQPQPTAEPKPQQVNELARETANALRAALSNADKDPGAASAAASRAATLMSSEPALALIDLLMCARVATCDLVPKQAKMRQLEPDNGAAAFAALKRADDLTDPEARRSAYDVVRAELAAATRYKLHWTRLIALASADGKETWTESQFNDIVGGIVTAFPVTTLLTICNKEAMGSAVNVGQCQQIAQRASESDALFSTMVGYGVAKIAWPKDTPQHAAATSEQASLGSLSKANVSPDHFAKYVQLAKLHGSEQEVLRALTPSTN